MLSAVSLCLLRWQPTAGVAMVLMLVLLPLFASTVPILVWRRLMPGWRQIAASPHGVDGPARGVTTAIWMGVWASVLMALAVLGVAGLPLSAVVRLAVNALVLTGLLTVASTWITLRCGAALAGAAAALGTVLSTLVGATGLMVRLWSITPWAWGVLAAGGQQVVGATVTAGVVLLGVRRLGGASMRLLRVET